MIAIAFTGQDGTGKSTQMELLRGKLESRGLSVGVVHQYGPTTRLGSLVLPVAKRLANRSGRSSGSGPRSTDGGKRRTRSPASCFAATISLALGWGRSLVNLLAHRAADVLILDRYFSDEIIRARHKFECGDRLGGWILRHGVPRPRLAITFTLDSRTGWERKKTRELTLDDYRRKVEIIDETLEGAANVWNLVRIPVDGRDKTQVFDQVWGHVEKHVAKNP